MRLTDEQIMDIKEYLNRSIKITISSLIPRISKHGLDLIDAVEALQQEIEQLRAKTLLDVVNSDLVKTYDGSALERADQYIGRLEQENEQLRQQNEHQIEIITRKSEQYNKLEDRYEELLKCRDRKDKYIEQLQAQVATCKDFILELIRRFEETPLDADGTHRLIVDRTFLIEAKATLERKVDTDGIYR